MLIAAVINVAVFNDCFFLGAMEYFSWRGQPVFFRYFV